MADVGDAVAIDLENVNGHIERLKGASEGSRSTALATFYIAKYAIKTYQDALDKDATYRCVGGRKS